GSNHLLAERPDLLDITGAFPDHGEFIATQSRGESACCRKPLQPLAHRDEDAIAKGMPHAIVDELEIVDVHEHDADQMTVRAGPVDRHVEQLEEMAAVRQSGQRVTLCQLLEAP